MNEDYKNLIVRIKEDISQTNFLMMSEINFEVVMLYWRIGRKLIESQFYQLKNRHEIVARLQEEVKNLLPYSGITFTDENINAMMRFARDYPDDTYVELVFTRLPWELTKYLLRTVEPISERHWYAGQALKNNWTLAELDNSVSAGEFGSRDRQQEIELELVG